MAGLQGFLRTLKPLIGTHKGLPQSVFRNGPDPLRLITSLSKPKQTCCIVEGDETLVLSTLEQAQHILSDPARLKTDETPVGISLCSKYSALFTLNLVKHVYYLPATYGRLPQFFNLVEDGIPFHYLLNPSAPRTPINVVLKEYEAISAIVPPEHSKSHDDYIKFLVNLPDNAITPWRKVPSYGSDEARRDEEFIKEYGEIQPPVAKPTLHALFGEIMSAVPVDVFPLIAMCREKSLELFDIEKTVDGMEKDTIGNEITRIFDIARNTAITFSSFSRMYSTYTRAHNPLTMLSPYAVKEFRDHFLRLWHEQGQDEEKAWELGDEVLRLSLFIEKIDKSEVFGKTPCPQAKGWPWV